MYKEKTYCFFDFLVSVETFLSFPLLHDYDVKIRLIFDVKTWRKKKKLVEKTEDSLKAKQA